MSVNAKMKAICDNIRFRAGGTAPINLDEIAESILTIGGDVDTVSLLNMAIGTTFPTAQLPAAPGLVGYDIDILNATADDVHAYIDNAVSGNNTVTKEILGKDASGKYDIARYIYANRGRCAWAKENYPKMYAWKNGTAKLYTKSVSPRVGDKAYFNPHTVDGGTTTETVVVPAQAALVEGYRWSGSGKSFSQHTASATVIVPTASIKSFPTAITLVGMTISANYPNVYGGNPTPTDGNTFGTASANASTLKMTSAADCLYFMVNRTATSGEFANAKVVVNGKDIGVVISSTTNYLNDVREESTTTVEVETDGSKPITEVRVATVASGATTNTIPSSRIIDGLEYVRSEADDVEPTVIYTDADDSRNGSESITQGGVTYNRYPLGDLGTNHQKLIPIFIYANEHGTQVDRLSPDNAMYQKYETKMCALVAARFLRDLADGKKMYSPLYKFIRENCMLIVIPVSNPFGYNMNVTGDTNPANDGYYNANNVNSNRNFDTPGWVISKNGGGGHHGSYPGSENETQYLMNTLAESGAAVAMSLHGIAGFFGGVGQDGVTTTYGHCAHQGQNPDGSHYDKATMDKISDFLEENYGYKMLYYDRVEEDHVYDNNVPTGESINLPDRACKSPSYITYCGAYGGIVEFQPDDIKVSGYQQTYKGYIIENAYAQMVNLLAMWLSDYLEDAQ